MALPTSPPITLRQIANEFQAGGIVSLRDFYRGGGLVPNIPQNSNIPTSGPISILDFLGATNLPPLTASSSGVYGENIDPSMPLPPATWYVEGFGFVEPSGGTGNYTYQWSITSGTGVITGPSNIQSVTVAAYVLNHSTTSGGIRCVVSDGQSSVTVNTTYTLRYSGGPPI